MPKRIGRYTLQMEHMPLRAGFAAVCGKKESEGPLGREFDHCYDDTTLGETSWGKGQSRLQTEAVTPRS